VRDDVTCATEPDEVNGRTTAPAVEYDTATARPLPSKEREEDNEKKEREVERQDEVEEPNLHFTTNTTFLL